MNRRSNSLVAAVWLISVLTALPACAEAQNAGAKQLVGHWVYASGESEGSTTAVYGDLKFNADGTFSDVRRIGGIGGFRDGKYVVKGDSVVLTYDAGKSTQTYAISFGTQKDKTGAVFETLLLKGDGLSFLLTRKQ